LLRWSRFDYNIEEIVVTGANLLKSESLKDAIILAHLSSHNMQAH